jgi:biotin carboxylase
MGEKEKARATMKREGVPILPGSDGIIASEPTRRWSGRAASVSP